MTKPKTVCQQIVESLRDCPEDWVQGSCTIDNRKLYISIWTANLPIFDTNLYSSNGKLYGLIEKYRVWRAIKRFRRYYQYEKVRE